MAKIKLTVNVIDKNHIFPMKAEYDPLTRIATSTGKFQRNPKRFVIDPNHIYDKHVFKRTVKEVYVDASNRQSVSLDRAVKMIVDGQKSIKTVKENVEVNASMPIHSDDPIDVEKTIKLDMLIDLAFWKSVMEKRKIAFRTVLLYLIAGIGIYTLIVLILRVFGFNV